MTSAGTSHSTGCGPDGPWRVLTKRAGACKGPGIAARSFPVWSMDLSPRFWIKSLRNSILLRRLYRDAIPRSITRLEAGSPTAGYHPREIWLSTLANVASVVASSLGTAVGVNAVYLLPASYARRIVVRFRIKLWIRSNRCFEERFSDDVDAELELPLRDRQRRRQLKDVSCVAR